ncbi:MAG: alpha/beta fold hydrolase [Xanthomonadales bacterium]|nr:alpha/beta fold hydrolase [Xanthomonadales bacterium]
MGRWAKVVGWALLGAALGVAEAAPSSAGLKPCAVPGIEGEARCGRIQVPERRDTEGGRSIELKVLMLPATGPAEHKARDAITFLAGGGVMPATRYAPFLARVLAPLRETRDIVLVDQRGTGESNPLACELPSPIFERDRYLDPKRHADAVAGCARELSARADLTAYNTVEAMHDLDEVRAALGYEQWSLWGVSYGTKAARVYLRQYPKRVRVIALYGVVPIGDSMWTDLPANERRALAGILDRCREDQGCNTRYPGLADKLAALQVRLAEKPHRFKVGTADVAIEGIIDDRALLQLLGARLSSTRDGARIPALIDQLHAGNYAALSEGLDDRPPPVPPGVYLSIACGEERPLWQPADRERDGDWLAHERESCAVWPRARHDAAFWKPVASSVPVLMLAGDEDHVTPTAYAEQAAATLSGTRLLRIPNAGHGDVNPCIGGLIVQAIQSADLQTLDTACIKTLPEFGFAEE